MVGINKERKKIPFNVFFIYILAIGLMALAFSPVLSGTAIAVSDANLYEKETLKTPALTPTPEYTTLNKPTPAASRPEKQNRYDTSQEDQNRYDTSHDNPIPSPIPTYIPTPTPSLTSTPYINSYSYSNPNSNSYSNS